MIVAVLAFLGGALTILSPCILPVLPFIFARTEQPFVRSTLPMLVGMAATFAAISTLAAVGGAWAVHLNDYGRILALIVLTLSALALLSRRVADWLTRPFVALGSRLTADGAGGSRSGILPSLVVGIATGFLWAPCAGPILGLILTGAALRGPSTTTTVLLLAYALGAATSLAVAAFASTQLIAALKRSFSAGEWVRRALGVAVLLAVVAIALGWDTGVLTRLSAANTSRIEAGLISQLAPTSHSRSAAMTGSAMTKVAAPAGGPPIEGDMPSLEGAVQWLNSAPLTRASLRGKVVVVDFWTYSCINCLRALPYVKSWYAHYKDAGLVVIGVHAPEFAFEKDVGNVTRAVHDLGITYPVALDNNLLIWQAFNNQYWPAHYFIDAQGRIRGHHFGEGDYSESEALIRELLSEAGNTKLSAMTPVSGTGIEASADEADVGSPETYVGYERADNFASPGGSVPDAPHQYATPATLAPNQWALAGQWQVAGEAAEALKPGARIVFRFHARDLHLVLGPAQAGQKVRFRITVDGHAPGSDHGVDVAPDGSGAVTTQRLYQLVRQAHPEGEHTFAIEFLDAGVDAYSFTFG
jgi:cytochrome c biogenesis protein CcdA/thiol-disulfide isomerase/thioredoxin